MDWEKLLELNLTQFYFITTVNIIYYIIGSYGNIISLIIFNKNEFKKQPATFYLNASCIMNLVIIFYSTIMFLAPIWQITSATCKSYQWLFGFILRFQAW